MAPKTKNGRLSISNMSDTNLLLAITMVVFVVMYVSAIALLGAGFRKPEAFFNILNDNAALNILS